MQNLILAFRSLSRNSGSARFYVLDFQTARKISIKGIKVRCAEFKTLMSILQGTDDINENCLQKWTVGS